MLAQPLINEKYFVGIGIGVVIDDYEEIFCYGKTSLDSSEPVTNDTLFAIGSSTKTFLSILLAQLVQEKRISLDDPVKKLIPGNVHFESEGLENTTFRKLASHSSGLDQEAYAIITLWLGIRYFLAGSNIYEGITQEMLLEYLKGYKLDSSRPYGFSYSNLGYAYLGWLLGNAGDNGIENLLYKKVIIPLGLNDTVFELNESQKKRVAQGYAGDLPFLSFRNTKTENWILASGIRSAGGLYSSLNDLMKYLKANMGLTPTHLYPAMQLSHKRVIKAGNEGYMGMGWYSNELPNSKAKIIYIDGLIGGYTSFIGFDEKSKIGVIVLVNSCNFEDFIGFELLDILISAQQKQLVYKNKS